MINCSCTSNKVRYLENNIDSKLPRRVTLDFFKAIETLCVSRRKKHLLIGHISNKNKFATRVAQEKHYYAKYIVYPQ